MSPVHKTPPVGKPEKMPPVGKLDKMRPLGKPDKTAVRRPAGGRKPMSR
jgi:hypothetical protein